jgi:putative membrane protein
MQTRTRRTLGTLVAGGAVAAAVACTGGAAQGAATPQLSAQDKHDMQTSASGDHFEINGGKIAQRSANPAVRALGARYEKDHAKSLKELKATAKRFHVSLPGEPTESQKWELSEVAQQSGAAMDRAYVTLEINDHKDDIDEATFEAHHGTNATLRAQARKDIKDLYEPHLKLARQTLKKIG